MFHGQAELVFETVQSNLHLSPQHIPLQDARGYPRLLYLPSSVARVDYDHIRSPLRTSPNFGSFDTFVDSPFLDLLTDTASSLLHRSAVL